MGYLSQQPPMSRHDYIYTFCKIRASVTQNMCIGLFTYVKKLE